MFRHHRWRMPISLPKYSFEDGHVTDVMEKLYKEYFFFGTSRTVHDDGLDALRMMRRALREGFSVAMKEHTKRDPWDIPKKRNPLRAILAPVDKRSVRVSKGQKFEPEAMARPEQATKDPFRRGIRMPKFRKISPPRGR